MSEYKQCRINFNCDDSNEMIAYEKFKSLGRKATEYVVDLILADLSGKFKDSSTSQSITSNELIEKINKLEERLSVLEESKFSANQNAEIKNFSKEIEESNLQTDSEPQPIKEVTENDKNDVIPMIPADVAARLGGF